MRRKLLTASALVAAAVLLLLLVPAGVVVSQEMMDVFVTNFPDPQRVAGTVSVEGPIRNAELRAVSDIIVSPVSPSDTTRLVPGGVLITDGYPYVVLSLTGLVKGEIHRSGTVGAFLVPDEEPIRRAFDEEGQIQFPLEISAAGVSGASPYFASNSLRYTLAFPSYRLYLYNTSDKTVSVTLYAYLTSS